MDLSFFLYVVHAFHIYIYISGFQKGVWNKISMSHMQTTPMYIIQFMFAIPETKWDGIWTLFKSPSILRYNHGVIVIVLSNYVKKQGLEK